MISKKAKILFGAALMSAACAAQATVTSVPLIGMNVDIRTWTDGGAYNDLYDTSQTFGGINFDLAQGLNRTTAIYGVGAVLPTNISNASVVYTLVNSAVGTAGADAGSITFYGSGGASYIYHYIEGLNIRDHFYGNYENSTSSSDVTQAVWGDNSAGHAHLDMQTIVLPSAFNSQTLTSIVFDSGHAGSGGTAFLAGLSVAAVPEPGEYAMLLLGLGLMGAVARRRR
jgi:hypothetical protein